MSVEGHYAVEEYVQKNSESAYNDTGGLFEGALK